MLKFFGNKIISNTFWLLSAQFLTKIIAFGYNVFLARSLGPNFYGLFVFGLTLFGLAGSVCDFGLARFLTRDLAKNPKEASKLTSQIFVLTSLTSLISAIILILAMLVFDRNLLRVAVGVTMIATIFPNSLAQVISATFTALEKMRYVAVAQIFLNLAVTLFGFWAVFVAEKGVIGVVLGFLLSHFLLLTILYLFLLKEKIKLIAGIDFEFWRKAVKSGLPYAVLAALGLVYFRVDSVLLTYLRGGTETGFYGAAYRFLDAVQFIPIAVSTALFPTFARLHQNSIAGLKKIYLQTLSLLSPVGILIAILLFATAPVIITLLYGADYQPSILALKILSLAIFFQFVHVPGAHLLFASEKFLKEVILLSIFTVGFNIVTNLIFIPIYGFMAAAVITLLSEILSFVVFFSLIWFKVFRTDGRS